MALIYSITAGSLWGEFWREGRILGTTINHVQTPEVAGTPFTVYLYALIAVVLVLAFALDKGRAGRAARALVLSFMAAGALMAMRMDYDWLMAFRADLPAFAGSDARSRLVAIGGDGQGLYDFLAFVKASLPEGASIRDVEDKEIERRVTNNDEGLSAAEVASYSWSKYQKYHLLPVLTRADGRFVVFVEDDMDGEYDPATMVLRVNRSRFLARPWAVYMEGAAVYEIIGEAG